MLGAALDDNFLFCISRMRALEVLKLHAMMSTFTDSGLEALLEGCWALRVADFGYIISFPASALVKAQSLEFLQMLNVMNISVNVMNISS